MKNVFVIFTRTLSTGSHRNTIGVVSTRIKAEEYIEKNEDEFNKLGIGIYFGEFQIDSIADLI